MAYLIAELGSNHNGDFATACALVRKATECGVDAVKFQSWTPTSLYAEEYLKENPEFYEDLAKHHLSIVQLKKLALVAEESGVDFICSVFSKEEADALEDVVDFYKIASMDLNNRRLLEHVAKKKKHTILSVGMGAPDEIGQAIEILRKSPLTVMHCVSLYPCPLVKANLNRIDYFKNLLDKQAIYTGYSDHTVGITAPVVAVSKGAWMIEKHFTLNKDQEGWDHAHSADPEEMTEIVRRCREVELLTQHSREQDYSSRQNMRRSQVSARSLREGHRLKDKDIAYKRPGTGYALDVNLVGKRLHKSVEKGHIFTEEDFDKS